MTVSPLCFPPPDRPGPVPADLTRAVTISRHGMDTLLAQAEALFRAGPDERPNGFVRIIDADNGTGYWRGPGRTVASPDGDTPSVVVADEIVWNWGEAYQRPGGMPPSMTPTTIRWVGVDREPHRVNGPAVITVDAEPTWAWLGVQASTMLSALLTRAWTAEGLTADQAREMIDEAAALRESRLPISASTWAAKAALLNPAAQSWPDDDRRLMAFLAS